MIDTADDMYSEMKDALRYFGLNFHERHLVKVRIADNKLIFAHGSKVITIDINKGAA